MTQIEIILLALLYEEDRYGYEIESVIEERNMRNWTKIGFSSIYSSLKNLEKKGLIGSRHEAEYGSPARKVYYLEDHAKPYVRETIKSSIHSPGSVYSEFSIGMAFSNFLTKEEVYECLVKYREGLEMRRELILQNYTKQPVLQSKIHLKALFTRPLKLIEAEVEWINELLDEIEEEEHDY